MATNTLFGLGIEKIVNSADTDAINYVSDDIRVVLLDGAPTINQDTDEFWSTHQADEHPVAGTYTANGLALGTKAVTYDAGTNEIRFTAAATVWAASTITDATYAMVIKWTGSAATSPLIGWIDFGGAQSSSAGDFTLTYDATGVFKFTVAA